MKITEKTKSLNCTLSKMVCLNVPISTTWKMQTPFDFRTFGLINSSTNLNWEYKEEQDSPEKLIEQFLWNEDALCNWMMYKDLDKFPPGAFQIFKVHKLIITKSENEKSRPFLDTFLTLSQEVEFESDEVVRMIKSHPKYEELLNRAKEIVNQNEEIQRQRNLDNEKTKRENNYQMWKVLQAKKEAGEFTEFEN